MKKYRILISGGGTGGHIFPALSIANALKERLNAEILFVGADNRMEMERVPAAGYEIKGLPVAGFDRRNLLIEIFIMLRVQKIHTQTFWFILQKFKVLMQNMRLQKA